MNFTPAKSVPLAGHNAIEGATFSVTLKDVPPADAVARMRDAINSFGDELPGEQTAPSIGLFVSFAGGMPPFGDAIRFVSKPNGFHSWRVQLTGNAIAVSCFEYTRFSEVWPRALKYLEAILNAGGAEVMVAEITHQYIDRFLYPGAPEEVAANYRLDELLLPDSPYLTQQALKSGLLWHVFQGWFDNQTDRSRKLNQLNISNTENNGAAKIACVIDHRCIFQTAMGLQLSATDITKPAHAGISALDDVMRELHDDHKRVLKAVLQPAKLTEIGMGA